MNPAKVKIALRLPRRHETDRYFSLRLKQRLDKEPAVFRQPQKLLVVSNIQGNFQQFTKLLLKWGVMNKYFEWSFGEAHLVILGDCLSLQEDVVACLWLIYSLEERARKKGGYVHFILGNLEILNLNGNWRSQHPPYAVPPVSGRNSPTALYDANSELWRWLKTKNIIEKIGTTLFVQGGISPRLLSFPLSVEQINELVRPYYSYHERTFTDFRLQLLFDKEYSPVWYRGQNNTKDDEVLLDAALRHFEAETLVTANPTNAQVAEHFAGKWINVYSNHAEEITEAVLKRKMRTYQITSSGARKRIK